MLSNIEKPKVGLLITALLEDEWNQTGYMRPTAQAALQTFLDALAPLAEVTCPGLVETEAQAEAADLAFKNAGVEAIVFVEMAYTQSIIVMRALKNAQVPIIVWNTQMLPCWPADASWEIVMLNSGLAGLPEATHALRRADKPFYMVTGHVADSARLATLRRYFTAAAITQRLKKVRLGMLGHPYQHMVDLMVDPYNLRDAIGPTLVHIDPEQFASAVEAVEEQTARHLINQTDQAWRTNELDPEIYTRSARIAIGLENIVKAKGLNALAIFDQALLADPRVGLVPSWGNSRLVSQGIPVTAEADLSVATAMIMLQGLAGDATFVENYGFDFDQNAAYIAHDSMGNPNMAAEQPQVALRHSIYYQGLYGWGAALEFAYRPGPVTFLALVPVHGGSWKMIAGEGHALPTIPRPTVAPQMLFRPSQSTIEEFYDRWCLAGAGHHSALAYGHLGRDLEIIASMIDIDFEMIQ